MNLLVARNRFYDTHTTGQLYINGEFFCFTLEDKVREEEGIAVEKWKIQDQTAIPRGIYKVTLENSPKFGLETPTLSNVPGFTSIRMHSGNTPDDTDGCIICGFRLADNGFIVPGTTRPAIAELKAKLRGQTNISIQVI